MAAMAIVEIEFGEHPFHRQPGLRKQRQAALDRLGLADRPVAHRIGLALALDIVGIFGPVLLERGEQVQFERHPRMPCRHDAVLDELALAVARHVAIEAHPGACLGVGQIGHALADVARVAGADGIVRRNPAPGGTVAGLAIDAFVDPLGCGRAVAAEAFATYALFAEPHPTDDRLAAAFADHAISPAVRAGGGGFFLPAQNLVLADRGAIGDRAPVASRSGATRHAHVRTANFAPRSTGTLLGIDRTGCDEERGSQRA